MINSLKVRFKMRNPLKDRGGFIGKRERERGGELSLKSSELIHVEKMKD